MAMTAASANPDAAAAERVYRRVTWRLLPFLGACCLIAYLDNGLHEARWLSNDEKRLLEEQLAADASTKTDYPLRALISIRLLWLFTAIYLLVVMGVYGINFWLPDIIERSGVESVMSIGWLTSASYLASALIAVAVARHAERHNEKRWHAGLAAIVGGASLALSAFACRHYGLRPAQGTLNGG
jgi:hypothetical protein